MNETYEKYLEAGLDVRKAEAAIVRTATGHGFNDSRIARLHKQVRELDRALQALQAAAGSVEFPERIRHAA